MTNALPIRTVLAGMLTLTGSFSAALATGLPAPPVVLIDMMAPMAPSGGATPGAMPAQGTAPAMGMMGMPAMPPNGGTAPGAMPGGMGDDKMGAAAMPPSGAAPSAMGDDKMGAAAMPPAGAPTPSGMAATGGGMMPMSPAMTSMMSMMMGQMGKIQPPPAAPLDHVEGRIAFMKAELQITDAQAPAWDQFAQSLRASRSHLDEARQALVASQAGQSASPVRLEAYERHLSMRLESLRAARESFQRLYATLSPTQKQSTDEIVSPLLASF